MNLSGKKVHSLLLDIFQNHSYEYENVDIVYISQLFVAEYLLGMYNEKQVVKQLKKFSLDDFFKYVYFKKNSFFRNKPTFSDENEIQFFFEINNKSMIDNLYSLYQHMKVSHENVKLIGNNQNLLTENIHNLFQYANLFQSCINAFKVRNDLKKLSALIANDLKNELTGLDEKTFRKYLYHHFLNNIFAIDTVKTFISNNQKCEKYILVTDVHKWSRILVVLAKKYKKQTYVLQHGAMVLEYGYLPVTTENFIAWGELSKKWLIERSTDSNRVQLLGSPKFDDIYETSNDINMGNEHLLVVVNPIGSRKIGMFFDIILPALKTLKIKTIIKLHPSTDDYRNIVEARFNEEFFEIHKNCDIGELIRGAKAVITTTSSVGIETILYKKPLFQVKISGLPKMVYEDYLCQHDIDSSEKIIDIVNSKALHSKLTTYDHFIDDYCGQLDGLCKERIKSFILEK